MNTRIVFADAYTLNPGDLDLSPLQKIGEFYAYDRLDQDSLPQTVRSAEILIVNKFRITEEVLNKMPDLRYITVAATGYNNIDAQAVLAKRIPVSNVSGYSTDSVAQHVFSMLLAWFNKVEYYSGLVKDEQWANSRDFCFYRHKICALKNRVMGIYGYGAIGRRVGEIAKAFGMQVMAHTRNPESKKDADVQFVNLEELLAQSDILSLHAPLTDDNRHIIDKHHLKLMKSNALIVNTARGALISEPDLLESLEAGIISGACLDVLEQEPPDSQHPLIHYPKCIVTPHIAWAGYESRKALLDGLVNNITAFMNGTVINRVL